MATWTTDIAGTGLAHRQPSPEELRRARLVAKRWAVWEPVLLYDLRKQGAIQVITELPRLRQVHTAILSGLLNSGISWRTIARKRKVMLDDPRLMDEERDKLLADVRRYILAQHGGRRAF